MYTIRHKVDAGVNPSVTDPFVVETAAERQVLANILEWGKGVVTVDTETMGCDVKNEHPRYKARATSVQFSTAEYPRIYLDNYRENEGSIQILKRWAQDATKLKDGHNIKYEAHVFKNHGIQLNGIDADTIVMDYLLDTSREGRHDLETAAFDWKVVQHELASYSDTFRFFPLTKKGVPSKKAVVKPHYEWWDEGDRERVITYGCKDTVVTRLLRAHHERKLRATLWGGGKSYYDYYRMIELPFTSVLIAMEQRGMVIDIPHLESLTERFSADIQKHGREFFRLLMEAGVPTTYLEGESGTGKDGFNPGSNKQLAHVLYDILGYECPKLTDGGDRSTDEDTLRLLQKEQHCDVLTPLFAKKELEKLVSTYTTGLVEKAKEYRGRVHSGLNQIGTATMRLSSSKPNLQNIPVRSALGKEIRKGFIAPKGKSVLCADYSQIELRVAAHKSRDATMVRYFHEGKDPHSLTAYSLFDNVRADVDAKFGDIDSKEAQKYVKTTYEAIRAAGKTWNFMVLYGGGEKRAMDVFGVNKQQAREKIDLFFSTYPGIRGMLNRAYAHVHEHGYVRTIIGRYCHVPGSNSPYFGMRKQAERQAGNYEIQGSAGDIVKMGMILIENDPRLRDLDYEQVMQVHDELLGYQPIGAEAEVEPIVCDLMSNSYKHFGFKAMIVDTPAEPGFGANWAEAKH